MLLMWLGEQITAARHRQRRLAPDHDRHPRDCPAPRPQTYQFFFHPVGTQRRARLPLASS
jgi:hypothetical protein